MKKMSALEFAQEVKALQPSTFITCASFESRCVEIAKIISEQTSVKTLCFHVDKTCASTQKNRTEIAELKWPAYKEAGLYISNPLASSDTVLRSVSSLSASEANAILVDVSTFTHEHLAMLIKALLNRDLLRFTHFAYVGVNVYGVNPSDESEPLWLSRGAAAVRSIVGYPGMLRPSRAVHFIALVGFEFERIRVALDESEPGSVSLGVGEAIESVTPGHYSENKRFYDKVAAFVEEKSANPSFIERFDFSCIDPKKAKQKILEIAAKHVDCNVVLFPMNTKLSTVGAIFASLDEPSIQLAYVEPVEYNVNNYSSGIDGFRLVSAIELSGEEIPMSSLFSAQ